MQVIQPVGQKLIVVPLPSEETKTEGGILALDFELERGEIIEVSDELSDIYSVGDIVIYPEKSGKSLPHYKKKNCLWLDKSVIWGILK